MKTNIGIVKSMVEKAKSLGTTQPALREALHKIESTQFE